MAAAAVLESTAGGSTRHAAVPPSVPTLDDDYSAFAGVVENATAAAASAAADVGAATWRGAPPATAVALLLATPTPPHGGGDTADAFHASQTAFIASFGITKAVFNLFVGRAADCYGRRRCHTAGWGVGIALAVCLLAAREESWAGALVGNVFLGGMQSITWSTNAYMLTDTLGPGRRALSAGCAHGAGYFSSAVAAFLAADVIEGEDYTYAFRWVLVCVGIGAVVSYVFVDDTLPLVAVEAASEAHGIPRGSVSRPRDDFASSSSSSSHNTFGGGGGSDWRRGRAAKHTPLAPLAALPTPPTDNDEERAYIEQEHPLPAAPGADDSMYTLLSYPASGGGGSVSGAPVPGGACGGGVRHPLLPPWGSWRGGGDDRQRGGAMGRTYSTGTGVDDNRSDCRADRAGIAVVASDGDASDGDGGYDVVDVLEPASPRTGARAAPRATPRLEGWSSIAGRTTYGNASCAVTCVVGFMTNAVTGLVWGMVLIYGRHQGLSDFRSAVVNVVYSLPKGVCIFPAGYVSDRRRRRKDITVVGLVVVVVGLSVTATAGGAGMEEEEMFPRLLAGCALIGVGTGVVYPTMSAAVGDHTAAAERATALGVFRFWRDLGYAAGALLPGLLPTGSVDASFAQTNIAVAVCIAAAALAYAVVFKERTADARRKGGDVVASAL